MFLHALVLNISAIITAASYPLVVRLYRLFEYICTFELLHEDFIHSVWNNIYIFVAVIVLFAIAIKLISAMVNPDLLTDSKKGAKSYYFRAVAAVILIFLVPIVFEKSFEIQEELLTKNMLSSHVFGYKVEEGTNLGQIFAWEGFSAFCLPDKASKDKIDNKYLSIRADMDNINSVMNEIRLQKSTKYALPTLIVLNDNQWEYHSILCPLVGLLLVYEMVLLCMDTLFRAAKLAFLQIMTPIVLGAFVFDPSILKKWAKEFFSTYISLFLKVLAMYFIAITISQIQAEIAKTDFYNGDWILSGLFKILLIIALLQLAKKIPDLINKIFGLEIKLRGGIKGRLGEMAGIGGIAQKAWTSLGNGFKNLGKATLQAPFAAAGFAANAMYKKKTGMNLTDTKAVRGLRAARSGLASAWKTGSIGKAVEAGSSAYTKTTASPLDKMKMAQKTNADLKRITTTTDDNGDPISVINSKNMQAKGKASNDIKAGVEKIAGSEVAKRHKTHQNLLEATSFASSMDSNFKAIIEANENRAQQLNERGRSAEADLIRAANEKFKASGNSYDMGMFMKLNEKLYDKQTIENMIGKNGKITSLERQKDYVDANYIRWGLTEDDHANFMRGEAALGFLASTTLKNKADDAKTDYDIAVAGARLSEVQKLALDSYVATDTSITNSKAFAVGRDNSENHMQSNVVPINSFPTFVSQAAQQPTQSTPASQSTPNSQGAPAPQTAPAQETVVERVDRVVGVSEPPTKDEHNDRYQSLVEAFSNSGIVEPTGNTGAPHTIINNYYNTSDEKSVPNKDKKDTSKDDNKEVVDAINKMGKEITESNANEGKATRDAINSQGNSNRKASEATTEKLDDIEANLNKPPKDNE